MQVGSADTEGYFSIVWIAYSTINLSYVISHHKTFVQEYIFSGVVVLNISFV